MLHVRDANDLKQVAAAYAGFLEEKSRPTMIIVESHIGYGSPNKQDSSKSHGSPLGVDEVKLTKKFYGWPEDASFLVPDGVYERFADTMGKRGGELHSQWAELFAAYKEKISGGRQGRSTPSSPRRCHRPRYDAIPTFPANEKGMATRESASKAENALAPHYPWLVGGSADLDESTKTNQTAKDAGTFKPESRGGRNVHFGVREHAMGAICNGMALSGLRPYGATFLIFSDYLQPGDPALVAPGPAVDLGLHPRLDRRRRGRARPTSPSSRSRACVPSRASSCCAPATPTRPPRPGSSCIGLKHNPAALILSRQPMPTLDRTVFKRRRPASRRGPTCWPTRKTAADVEVILMGTGSELYLCVETYEALAKEGIGARVVSMPCWEQFELQDDSLQG